jgi:hypothetical protein
MHEDLKECIDMAKIARKGLIEKTMDVRRANAIASQNHAILSAHAIDLRERIFIAQSARNSYPAIESE